MREFTVAIEIAVRWSQDTPCAARTSSCGVERDLFKTYLPEVSAGVAFSLAAITETLNSIHVSPQSELARSL